MTTRPVAIATVTVTSAPASPVTRSTAEPATTTRTVSATSPKASAMTCPSADALNAALHQDLVANKVRCFDGNAWLIVTGLLPSGQQADGVVLIEQTKPGSFTAHGAGSDWGTAVDNLRAEGVPDDVIAELPGVTLTPTSASAAKHPFSDFVGTWGGHERLLTIGADHTGKLILGVGCCDSVSVAMKYTLQPDGRLAGTATGKPSYTGTAMNSVTFGPGPSVWFYFQSTPEGEFLMSDGPGNASGTTWCSDQQVGLCGA